MPGTTHCLNVDANVHVQTLRYFNYTNAGVPKKNVNAVEDFLQVILAIYVASATGKALGIGPEDIMKTDNWERPVMSVHSVANTIVAEYTKLSRLVRQTNPDTQQPQDAVLEHTRTLLTLVLLWFHYRDVSREGDGDRFLQVTPVLLHLFRSTQHKNYATEAAIIQLQYHYLMSERMRTQLLYSRFVNMHATRGRNIPCDLHMEHLNR